MSVAAAQAEAFYRELLDGGSVFTVRDEGGYPAPRNGSGQRAQPFWSTRSRAQRIVDGVPAYAGFEVVEISMEEWRERWLPGLEKNRIHAGLNWSGERATGYDLPAADVLRNLDARSASRDEGDVR
jgi:hypothetical protein